VTSGKLVHVLGPFAPMAPGVFLYYPGHRQIMPKLRAFIDHVRSYSGATKKSKPRHEVPPKTLPMRRKINPAGTD
jgi:hypothetical protein